jgi:hypothetical protein
VGFATEGTEITEGSECVRPQAAEVVFESTFATGEDPLQVRADEEAIEQPAAAARVAAGHLPLCPL